MEMLMVLGGLMSMMITSLVLQGAAYKKVQVTANK